MRNPIRLKNFNQRFLPFYLVGLLILVWFPPERNGFWVAAPLIFAGLVIRSWGAGHLVKNDVLTTSGPYRHLRHPLYAGTILGATGFAFLVGGFWTWLVLACLWPWFGLHYFPRKERSESARLESLYGEPFAEYRAAVPALWPRLSPWRRPEEPTRDGAEASPGGGAARWALEKYSENNELGTLIAVLAAMLVFWLRATGPSA